MRKFLTFLIALASIVFAVGSPSQAQVGGLMFPGPRSFASGGAWTPASLGANLIAWYKADTGVTGTATVTAWADQSGNGNNVTQPSATPAPSWSATGLNSKPAIIWTLASGQQLATDGLVAPTVLLGTGTSYAIFGIASTTANSIGGFYNDGWSITDGGFGARTLSANGATPALTPDYSGTIQSSKAMTINTSHRIGVNNDGTNSTAYVDGSAGTPGASGAPALW
jgi:hypothetical protein